MIYFRRDLNPRYTNSQTLPEVQNIYNCKL